MTFSTLEKPNHNVQTSGVQYKTAINNIIADMADSASFVKSITLQAFLSQSAMDHSGTITSFSTRDTLAYSAGTLLVCGDNGKLIYSNNANRSWSDANTPAKTEPLYAMAEDDSGNLVAVGAADATDAYILTSSSATNWTERSNPKAIGLRDVAWANGLWVAVGLQDGTDAYIITSPDGITWTERSNPKNLHLVEVIYSNGLWVAAGEADATDAYIVTSPDGITWTERANPETAQIEILTYFNGRYIAITPGLNATGVSSTDGINWSADLTIPSPLSSLVSAMVVNDVLIVDGINNTYLYSLDGLTFKQMRFTNLGDGSNYPYRSAYSDYYSMFFSAPDRFNIYNSVPLQFAL